MSWNIVFFESRRGERLVEEFIKVQQPSSQAKIAYMFDLLEKFGPALGRPYTKKIKANLFELRIPGKEPIRILYTVFEGSIVFLHAFKKKTQKIPAREIKTALLRLEASNAS